MARYVLRVFRDNVTGWVPTILVVAVVTTLVGICMNQFVWTSSPLFTLAARQAGLDPAEFGMVSVTIYVVVSLLAFFSLTVVGSATVNRIHGTFAQWRLMGASPSQVLASMWMLVGVASLFGSLIGSLAAVPASLLAVPEFNAMAAESFADGFGSFAPPAFTPSMAAWLGSLLLGVATCMLGASIPSLRAAKIRPIPVSEMERRGVSRTEISRFVREAKLEKAAKGLYVSPNAESDPLFELQYRYPKAIFSHETALFLLGEGASPPDTDDYLTAIIRYGSSQE